MKIPQWIQDLNSKYGVLAKLKDLIIDLLNKYVPDQQATSKPREVQGKSYEVEATVVDTKGLFMRMCRGVVAKGTMSVAMDELVWQSFNGEVSVTVTPTSVVDSDGDPFWPSVTGKLIGAQIGPVSTTISGQVLTIKGFNDKVQWDGVCTTALNWSLISGRVVITGDVNMTVEIKAVLK
jgi:hypothetical protein